MPLKNQFLIEWHPHKGSAGQGRMNRTEKKCTEQNRTDLDRAGEDRAGQSRLNKTEKKCTEQNRTDLDRAGESRAGQDRAG